MPAMPSPQGQGVDVKGDMDSSTLHFIIGALAGAGMPVLARALRPGRTAGERGAAAQNPLSPQSIISTLSPSPQPGPDQGSLIDLLPMLAAKLGPRDSGLSIPSMPMSGFPGPALPGPSGRIGAPLF